MDSEIVRKLRSVTRENTEICDQAHQMFAEGTSDIEPKEIDIQKMLAEELLAVDEIEIFFDNLQGFWRWSCKIAHLKTTT